MMKIPHLQPGLLVSVRNAAEAEAALAGGADWIDVKEPNRGALGAADAATIAEILSVVGTRAPVSAAAGEWNEASPGEWREFPELARVKLGLACAASSDSAQDAVAHFAASLPRREQLVLTAYADFTTAGSPAPKEVLAWSESLGLATLLVDTFDKSAGDLFSALTPETLQRLIAHSRERGIQVVLAGGLRGAALAAAAELGPVLVGVRGAVCRGGRTGTVATDLVRSVLVP